MGRYRGWWLAAACVLVAFGSEAGAQGDRVIIRGGTVYTGGEDKPFVGEVEMRGDRIVYVGPTRRVPGGRVVDARGKMVTPGLIDAHTHPETFLRSPDPAARVNAPWLAQGVATIVIGVDGYGTPDIAADAAVLTRGGIGINVVPFIGFGAVRTRVLGQDARAPSPAELARMQALVAKGMCEGAAGLSTGLFYAPQSFATTDEVIAVAREAARRGGLYDTHQRDESSYSIGLFASLREVLRIGREAGMPVHIAHLKALGVDVQGQAPQIIALIDAARRAGQDVTADQYPWLASGTSLDAALVPRWAVDGGFAALIARLDDPALATRIRGAMRDNLKRRGGAGAILLNSPDFPWSGKTLAAMATAWNLDPVEAAIRILRGTRDAPEGADRAGASIASFNMAEPDVEAIMRQPWVVTGSDGSDGHPRQFATMPETYRKYVVGRRVIDTATFIRRSTGLTADIYRLDRRGYLRRGYHADVAVIDPARFAPRADYVHPAVLSVGVDALYVNGRLAFERDRPTGITAGRVLLRPTPAGCPAG
ncbi:amidohydrolase family protein [Sphingomonas sp. RP10(2022)]|uniref:Amidohydrolase family protein n=1 Tax=Sphingomonas liriopis TaxID=2949094 RepID=A0A9X2HPM1_9SPHN|nr:amidohydrolase family protein [Sphingomonas liriopis]MCP3733447.1 amidohydrolase family protein [Sphingomonas liriopis]